MTNGVGNYGQPPMEGFSNIFSKTINNSLKYFSNRFENMGNKVDWTEWEIVRENKPIKKVGEKKFIYMGYPR